MNAVRQFFGPVGDDLRKLANWLRRSFEPVEWTPFRDRVDGDKPFFDYAKNVLALVAWWGALVLIFQRWPDTAISLSPFALFGVLLAVRLAVTTQLTLNDLRGQLRGTGTWLGRLTGFVARWAFGFTALATFYMIYQVATAARSL